VIDKMAKEGKAISYGAVTIINAIACDLGASLGIDLWTKAHVKLTDEPNIITGRILSDSSENIILMKKSVSCVLNHFGLEKEYGAYVETQSNIPIARGLKSSSAAANAIVLATIAALDIDLEDMTAIKIGVDAAIDAQVTITGAFDDACASYFGDIVMTNNFSRRIMKQFTLEKDFTIIILVPARKVYTKTTSVDTMRLVKKEVMTIHRIAVSGDYWTAMTLNGLIYSPILGYDLSIMIDALSAGAIATSLSGTGPAVAAVVLPEQKEELIRIWKTREGRIIETKPNHKKAHIVR
jgi:shikimate kinase